MNANFYFIYPAKVVTASRNLKETKRFQLHGFTIAEFEGNVYLNTTTGKIVTERVDTRSYFLVHGDKLCYVTSAASEDVLRANLDRPEGPSHWKVTCEKCMLILDNPDAYAEKQAVAIAERHASDKADRERREREQVIVERAHFEAKENAIESARTQFIAGEHIDWYTFEALCERNNVKLPISLKGWGRKQRARCGTKACFGDTPSKTVWTYVRALSAALG